MSRTNTPGCCSSGGGYLHVAAPGGILDGFGKYLLKRQSNNQLRINQEISKCKTIPLKSQHLLMFLHEVPLMDERPRTPGRGLNRSPCPMCSSVASASPESRQTRPSEALSSTYAPQPQPRGESLSTVAAAARRKMVHFVDVAEVREFFVHASDRTVCRSTRAYHGTRSRYGCTRETSPHRRPTPQAKRMLLASVERARDAAVIAALVGTAARAPPQPLFDVHPRAATPTTCAAAARETRRGFRIDPATDLLASVMAKPTQHPMHTQETPAALAEQLLLEVGIGP